MPEDGTAAPRLNAKVPHSARIWNFWLGGKDNFEVDRELGEQLRQVYPAIADRATDYIEADFREPEALLAAAAATLDFTQPVAVLLLGVLGHFGDDSEVAELIERVMAATVRGSYLVIAHGSSTSEGLAEAARQYRAGGAETYHLRSPEQLAGFLAGLDLVPPGVVPVPQWRPDPGADPGPAEAYSHCAVGRVQ